MAYLKPQSLIQYKTDHIYPLTTADQVILSDGSRLEKNGKVYANQATNADALNGKSSKYYIQPRNLLDNSEFEVAQAGYNASHNASEVYAADRWISGAGSTLTKNGETITYNCGSSMANLTQNLWNDGRDKGKTYTAALTLADDTVITCCGTVPMNATQNTLIAETYFGEPTWCMYLYKTADGMFFISMNAGGENYTLSFKHIALYEGEYTADSIPPYVSKGYAAELSACQRYFHLIPNAYTFYGFKSSGGSSVYVYFDLPQLMRITPSCTFSSTDFLMYSSGSYSSRTKDSVNGVTTFGKQLEINISESNISTNRAVIGYITGRILVSADL